MDRAPALPALLVALVLAALPARAAEPLVTPAERRAAEAITPAVLLGHVRFLASDLLEGRAPGSRGDALAQAYIAAQFEALGLEPASPDGGYVQSFELVGVAGHPERVAARGAGGSLELRHWHDVIAVAGEAVAETRLDDSELVFVGYGIVAAEFGWDDFKGLDVRGKTLLVLNSDPDDDPRLFGGRARLQYGRWDYKYEQAARLGAAGVLIIHTTPSAGYPWQVVQTSWTGEQFDLPESAGEPHVQLKGWATEEAARRLVALGGHELEALRRSAGSRDFRPVSLGVRLSTAFRSTVHTRRTANVLARLRGSDPELAGQVVLYTAHHDHLGRNDAAAPGEDGIFNGAVDNAAGVAGLLALARAFRELPQPPPRSVLFAAVAAEEQGLLGSQYLARHLPVPAGRVAANVNLDGANVWGRTRDVTAIGLGKSTLDDVLGALARLQGRKVRPDQLSDRGFFYRSDQFSFAKLGIPAAYFGSGMDFIGRPPGWGRRVREAWERLHYHQPSDEVRADWDLSGAVEDFQLCFLLGAHVARDPQLPSWRPGDEFERPRQRALEALRPR